jgi:hypothetical protein
MTAAQANVADCTWENLRAGEIVAMVPLGNDGWLRLLSHRTRPAGMRTLLQLAQVGATARSAQHGTSFKIYFPAA